MGGYLSKAKVDPVPYLSTYLSAFRDGQQGVCTEPLVTPEALHTIGCVRGPPLPPPPQPLVPRVLVLSSGESGGSEGDVVEGEESSSGGSDPDYRGMSDEAENARAILAAYKSQNSKRPRRGEPSRSRAPRASPRSSPPGQVPVPRSRHSSASTTADNPAPGFAAPAPGYAAPMGSAFAMPTASPSLPVSIPPSVSLLQGDVLAEDVMRSLVSARDREESGPPGLPRDDGGHGSLRGHGGRSGG
nr:hypothetical protein Iba_chr14bCG12060 [Ipomoea batatas]